MKMNALMNKPFKKHVKRDNQPKLSDFKKFDMILKEQRTNNKNLREKISGIKKVRNEIRQKQIKIKESFIINRKKVKQLEKEYKTTRKSFQLNQYETKKFDNKIYFMEKDINLRRLQINVLQFIKSDMEKKRKHVNEAFLLSKNILKNTKKEIVENEYIKNLILYKEKVDKFIAKRDKKITEINILVSEVTELRKMNIKKNLLNQKLILNHNLLKKEQKSLKNEYKQQRINFNNVFVIINLLAINHFIFQYKADESNVFEDSRILMEKIKRDPLSYLNDILLDDNALFELSKLREMSDEYFDFESKSELDEPKSKKKQRRQKSNSFDMASQTGSIFGSESIENSESDTDSRTQYGINIQVTKPKSLKENNINKEGVRHESNNISGSMVFKNSTDVEGQKKNSIDNQKLLGDNLKRNIGTSVISLDSKTIKSNLLFSNAENDYLITENNKRLFNVIKTSIDLQKFVENVVLTFTKMQSKLNKVTDQYNANILSKEVKLTKLFDLNNSKKFLKCFYGIADNKLKNVISIKSRFLSFMKNRKFLKNKRKSVDIMKKLSISKKEEFCSIGEKKVIRGKRQKETDDLITEKVYLDIDIKDIAYVKDIKLKLLKDSNYVSNQKIELMNIYYITLNDNRLIEGNIDVNQKIITLSYILFSKIHEKLRLTSKKIIDLADLSYTDILKNFYKESEQIFNDKYNRDQHFIFNYIHFTKIILLRIDGHNFNLLFKLFNDIKNSVFVYKDITIIENLIKYLFYNAKDINFDVITEFEDILLNEIERDLPSNEQSKNINGKFSIIYCVMLSYFIKTNESLLAESMKKLKLIFSIFKRSKDNSLVLKENEIKPIANQNTNKRRSVRNTLKQPLNRNSFIIKARKSKMLTNLNKTFCMLGQKEKTFNITTRWSKSPEQRLINFKFNKREKNYNIFQTNRIDKIYKDYKLLNYKIKTIQTKNKGKKMRLFTEKTKDMTQESNAYVFDTNSNRVNPKYKINTSKITPFFLKGERRQKSIN